MDSSDIEPIDRFKNDIRYRDKIVHVETIPSKKAKYKKIVNLNGRIIDYLESKNVKLYEHQAEAYEHIQNKENIIITTPTASGKTLAFNLPIMETMIEDEEATALYIYPAKALSNDQLHVLENLEKELDIKTNPRTYDGDTPKDERYGIRQKSRIVLTNPYQLHLILSWHPQWERFYRNLKYIVIDESHYYKGVFGSNVAFLIRRLKRIANFYGSNPQFILSSATLANPLELANKLTGEEFVLIDKDTSPSGEKDFILYNPFKNKKKNKRNSKSPSVHVETEEIFLYLIFKNIQTLCFTVSRKMAELIARWSKNEINNIKSKLVDRVTAYRAGYRPEERREIEEGLKSRKYLGVTCTNALELGINIGSLDAVIISGYPGTMVSVWQQSGRAGRSNQKSLAILVAFENQLDQYFMNNPDFFFDKPHENVFIDLNNSILRNAHILCAANELDLSVDDSKKYFDTSAEVIYKLVEREDLRKTSYGKYAYSGDYDNPAFNHSLDQLSSEEFRVFYNRQVFETMGRSQVYREAHEGAVLINKGESYIVDKLNLRNNTVNIVKEDVDYHTVVLNRVIINIKRKISKTKFGDLTIHFGELTVTEDYYKYKKIQFSKTLGSFDLDLPPLKFTTKGLWFTIPDYLKEEVEDAYNGESIFEGGLHGVEHALIGLFPLHVMCDNSDIGGLSTKYHEDTQESTIFIYDSYEGGIGITEKAMEIFPDLVKSTYDSIKNCGCVDGCPACIYSPKWGNDNKHLHKKATKHILGYMCSKMDGSKSKVKEKSNEAINEEISNKKDSFEVEYEEAYDLYCQGDYFSSKEILNDILSKDKKNSDAWALIAMILYEQGDKQGAINFNKRALNLDSANEIANDLFFKLNNL